MSSTVTDAGMPPCHPLSAAGHFSTTDPHATLKNPPKNSKFGRHTPTVRMSKSAAFQQSLLGYIKGLHRPRQRPVRSQSPGPSTPITQTSLSFQAFLVRLYLLKMALASLDPTMGAPKQSESLLPTHFCLRSDMLCTVTFGSTIILS